MKIKKNISYFIFCCFFIANLFFWTKSHHYKTTWHNVPALPEIKNTSLISMGDAQFAYRSYALTLQNLGDTNGRKTSLKNYDYAQLYKWFLFLDQLDPRSSATPMMAAYYYGSVRDKQKLDYVLDYLSIVGQRPEGEKWRWLGHAVFLARHEQKDNDRALELAYLLAANKSPDLADWAKQMPAFILQEQGDTELAYKIMLNLLKSNVDSLHPTEINYMVDYICNTLLKENVQITPPDFCN